jgi:hypothetical protein
LSNGKIVPSISRPITCITPRHIPGNYTFAVFFSIENVSVGNHMLQIIMNNTNGQKMFDTNPIELNPTLQTLGGSFAPIEISAEIRNAVIEAAGQIEAQVYLDGEMIDSNTLGVNQKN